MSVPASTSITVARSGNKQALLVVADAETAQTDFLAGSDRYVALQGLDSSAVRIVGHMVTMALRRRATHMKLGNQSIVIDGEGASIVFRQDGRSCIVSRADAREVARRCHSVANDIDLNHR